MFPIGVSLLWVQHTWSGSGVQQLRSPNEGGLGGVWRGSGGRSSGATSWRAPCTLPSTSLPLAAFAFRPFLRGRWQGQKLFGFFILFLLALFSVGHPASKWWWHKRQTLFWGRGLASTLGCRSGKLQTDRVYTGSVCRSGKPGERTRSAAQSCCHHGGDDRVLEKALTSKQPRLLGKVSKVSKIPKEVTRGYPLWHGPVTLPEFCDTSPSPVLGDSSFFLWSKHSTFFF